LPWGVVGNPGQPITDDPEAEAAEMKARAEEKERRFGPGDYFGEK
jgi:hypothetical protein